MVRKRASAVLPRYFDPSYHLRRPRRLFPLFAFFLCSTVLLWDRHNLVVSHEFLKLASLRKEKGETPPTELEFQAHERSVSQTTGGRRAGLLQRFLRTRRKPPVIGADEDPVRTGRYEKVRDAMRHAWTCYERYAWGMDKLKVRTSWHQVLKDRFPSKLEENQFAGLGATTIDSLDTLYIMGFEKQFEEAREKVVEILHLDCLFMCLGANELY